MRGRFSKILVSMVIVWVFSGVLSAAKYAEAYDNTFPFSSLGGSWLMTNGTGNVRVGSDTASLTLDKGDIWVSSLSINNENSGGSARIRLDSDWKLHRSGSSADYPLDFDTNGTFINTNANTYSISYSGGTTSGNVVIVLTSAISGNVTQTEMDSSPSEDYAVTITYNITKVSNEAPDDDDESSSSCNAGLGWLGLVVLAGIPLSRRPLKKQK